MKTEKESGQRLQRGAIIWFLGVEDIHYSDYKKDESSFEKLQRGHQKSNKIHSRKIAFASQQQ